MRAQPDLDVPPLDLRDAEKEVFGYLNFSSGLHNPRFFLALNRLYMEAGGIDPRAIQTEALISLPEKTPETFRQLLEESATKLERSGVFPDTEQARRVIGCVYDRVVPAYQEYHADLLRFDDPFLIHQPFFLGRVMEAVLQVAETWEEEERIVREAIQRLNDYVGYRPVPVLETRRYEPYPHERLCPIPIYIRGAGVACCRYGPLVWWTLKILQEVPDSIALQADFDFEQLEEIALDPRPLDFQHPLQHRPNNIYGSWDLHRLDRSGRYCRYIVQKANLDFLCRWVAEKLNSGQADPQVTIFQAAGVLANTTLMAMGISGGHPSAIPSTENLGRLVDKIASYREEFYQWLHQNASRWLGQRAAHSAPGKATYFAEVRRSLNRSINDYRAREAHRSRFVQLMAELGQQDIVTHQLELIFGATARMTARIHAAIHRCHALIRDGHIDEAAAHLPEIFQLILRGIDCGAIVDPWNILGFGGMFPLAPSPEDSIPDERITYLLGMVERLFDLHAQIMKAAAAVGKKELVERVSQSLAELADWWDQFATTKVSEVVSFSGKSVHQSAQVVAEAIAAWHQAGATSGDVAFWREHASQFRSPKAFASAMETLLQHGDSISALALMIHWISLGQEVGLREGSHHLPALAAWWIYLLWQGGDKPRPQTTRSVERFPQPQTPEEKWQWTRRFFNYLEANGSHWWQVPIFRLADNVPPQPAERQPDLWNQQEQEAQFGELFPETFAAAYEGVIFRESALDGIDAELLERRFEGLHSALVEELKRLTDHLFFLASLGALWQYTALQIMQHPELDLAETVEHWLTCTEAFTGGLERLAHQILQYPIQPASASLEDMTECGQRLQLKESLLMQVVEAWIKLEEARWTLAMLLPPQKRSSLAEECPHFAALCEFFISLVNGADQAVAEAWRKFRKVVRHFSTCYKPLEKGGSPRHMVSARVGVQLLGRLLALLARRGHLRKVILLLQELLVAEKSRPSVGGEVSQLASLFLVATEALARAVVISSQAWPTEQASRQKQQHLLQVVLTALQRRWEQYAGRTLLSPVERICLNAEVLEEICEFIRTFGRDLFKQAFLNYANLLSISHMGAVRYIRQMLDRAGEAPLPAVFEKVREGEIPLDEVAAALTAVVEPILTYYTHYIEYNSSTTESDRGENLHLLLRHLLVVACVDRIIWTHELHLHTYRTLLRLDEPELAEHVGQLFAASIRPDLDSLAFWYREAEKLTGVQLATVRRAVTQADVYPLRLEQLRYWARRLAEAQTPEVSAQAAKAIEDLAEQFLAEPQETGFEEPEWFDIIRQEFRRQEKIFTLLESTLQELTTIDDVFLSYKDLLRQCEDL